MNKTEGVKLLVQDVVRTISEPYNENIIWDVFMEIENNRDWKRRYDELEEELIKDVVNNWIGKYTKALTGMKTIRQVDAPEDGHIAGSYTKLRY